MDFESIYLPRRRSDALYVTSFSKMSALSVNICCCIVRMLYIAAKFVIRNLQDFYASFSTRNLMMARKGPSTMKVSVFYALLVACVVHSLLHRAVN